MEVLSFTLSGKTAHFKREDVNAHTYFTYSHIHKMALYGILGSIVGLKGYNDQGNDEYPEFYDKLKNLEVAILPMDTLQGRFRKKIHFFNNSVGYGNVKDKMGQNLIVREQWLENVKWKIVINLKSLKDVQLAENLTMKLLNRECVYMPYLGKNDHLAVISEVKKISILPTKSEKIDSLFYKEDFELKDETENDDLPFLFQDQFPVGIDECLLYTKRQTCLTNRLINQTNQDIYLIEGSYITFI